MIGNDVVDLGDEDSAVRRHHVRFDTRVFAAEELDLLASSADPEHLRWSMWAAKEAAFKLLKACSATVVFAPSSFVVRPSGRDTATVEVDGTSLSVDFQRTSSYVHAIARRQPLVDAASREPIREPAVTPREAAATAVAEQDAGAVSASEAVRRLAVTSVARLLGEDAAGLSVGSDGRVPLLFRCGRRLPGSLSLSHHGRFVAFAWSPVVTRSERRVTSSRRGSPGASRARS